MFQKKHISEGFKYLGIVASDNSGVLDNNYDINIDTVDSILTFYRITLHAFLPGYFN